MKLSNAQIRAISASFCAERRLEQSEVAGRLAEARTELIRTWLNTPEGQIIAQYEEIDVPNYSLSGKNYLSTQDSKLLKMSKADDDPAVKAIKAEGRAIVVPKESEVETKVTVLTIDNANLEELLKALRSSF